MLEGSEILLAFLHALLRYQIEGGGHLLGNFWSLNFPHCLPHLVLVGIRNSYDLIGCRNLALRNLMRIFHVVLKLEIALSASIWLAYLKV